MKVNGQCNWCLTNLLPGRVSPAVSYHRGRWTSSSSDIWLGSRFRCLGRSHPQTQAAAATARTHGSSLQLCNIQGSTKSKPQTSVHIFAKYWPIFKFFSPTHSVKICKKRLLNIPPHPNCVTTLPCKISSVTRQTYCHKNKGTNYSHSLLAGSVIASNNSILTTVLLLTTMT